MRAPAWERWKPAAPARVHLLAAALLWTGVGVGLGTAGAVWTFGAAGGWGWALVSAALVV
ncbi:MAG: hypothetical protein GXP50_00665, partial [Deltaproteobacteria bacterium]|nr:hypothetical protein [Deltaproteobacteria bacterium]